jgi:hypothetical protein
MLADGENCSEVYSAATAKEQASIVFRAAKRFVTGNPELNAAVKKFRFSLAVEATD